MRVLVTGAEGFVGGHLLPRLADRGHEAVAAVRTGADVRVEAEVVLPFDLRDYASIRALAAEPVDAVIHLAAWSATSEAADDPGEVYQVNVAGTARLAEALSGPGPTGRPRRFLHVSSALVYGSGGETPFTESDPSKPVGVYAGSKLASEVAVLEVHRRTGLEVVVARPFLHTGAGQDERFVVPAFARRIREAQRRGAPAIEVGNLDPVRDIMHVGDVVDAYVTMLERGTPGEVYNVASGVGTSIRDLFSLVAEAVGYRVVPEVAAGLVRGSDSVHLVGNADKLQKELNWVARRTLAEAIREVVDAQAH